MQIESDKKLEETGLFKIIPNYNKYSANYVYLALDIRNEVTIKSVLRQLGFKPHQYNFKYHATLCYSDEQGDFKDWKLELKRPITDIEITGVRVLGDYIVLDINAHEVVELHNELVQRGFAHKHEQFIPHISILIDTVSEVDVNIIRQNINRIKSVSLRLENLVYDNNVIKHYE